MDQNGIVSFRHRQSPSSDRFLGVFSPPQNEPSLNGVADLTAPDADELNEDDVFWTGRDFTESQRRSTSPSQKSRRQSFRQPESSGILAALPEYNHRRANVPVVLRQKPSVITPSSESPISRAFPSIPKPQSDPNSNFNHSKSMPVRNFQHSAPMNVPIRAKNARRRNGELADVEIDDEDDEEMFPPHEMVARGSMRSPKTTNSVLEGVGRTLKGRDLRQVRNAVWRQIGFQD